MANILCIYENKIATVADTENFFADLEKNDPRIAVRFVSVSKLAHSDLSWCDALYMIRPNNAVFGRIAKISRQYGIIVVFFLDDDLLHLPEGNADIPWRKSGLAYTARRSDIIVSSSPYICRNYSKSFAVNRRFSIDAAVPPRNIRKHDDGRNERIKIVYAAGLAHKSLFDRFIKPILTQLDEKCGEKISITFMGVHPELDVSNYNMPINYIDSLPLNEYRAKIAEENFDIGLAPLTTSEFTKCKYFNKFIEYAMFGIVGLYSDTEPYTFVIKDKENGILVKDEPSDWLRAICIAVEDGDLIKKCRENSYDLLTNRFASDKIMDQFIAAIPEIVKEHKEKSINDIQLLLCKVLYGISRFGDWLYKTGFYFKRGGIKEVFNGVRRIINTSRVVKS